MCKRKSENFELKNLSDRKIKKEHKCYESIFEKSIINLLA